MTGNFGGRGGGGGGKAGRGLAFSKPNATTLRVAYDDGTGQTDFTVAGLNPRNAWAAATAYAVNDTFTQGGSSYRVTAAHTSPATFAFDSAKMEVLAAAGAAAPDPLIVTGLTGGTTGCICYLVAPGVVRDLDRSMLGKLRDNIPRFFKHPNGNYYLLNQGQITGLSGLTAGLVMTLKQKTSNADTNVAYYDRNASNGYTPYAPTAFQAYLEPGQALSASTLLANLTLGSIRFGDITGTPVQTVQDKIATTGTYAYTDGAAIPAGIWTYPWGNFGGTFRFTQANTNSSSPNGAIAEFNNTAYAWQVGMHAGITAFVDGGMQTVVSKGDGNRSPMVVLNRVSGTGAAPVGVGVYINSNDTAANRTFSLGYFNGNTNWVNCTDPASGNQLAPTLDGGVGFRVVLDTIGTFVGAKIWPTGGTEPSDYTLWGWQNSVMGAGGVGVGGGGGRVWIGDFGAYWAAPGSAPRGP